MVEKKVIKPASKVPKTRKSLTAPLFDLSGKEVGTVDLPSALFAVTGPKSLLAQYVRVYLANQRQGTASTKTRSEITGSTRKIYRQKGTGRARHGANKAPIFVGGGVAFGPRPQDHSLSLNKKQKSKALFMSLSTKLKENNILVVAGLDKATGKTKQMNTLFTTMKLGQKVLFIHPTSGVDNGVLGSSNIPAIKLRDASVLNAYDILNAQKIVFAKEGLDSFLQLKQKTHEN